MTAPEPSAAGSRRATIIFAVVIFLFGGAFVLGGFMTYRAQRDGVPAVATVTECRERLAKYGGDVCRGRWFVDGRLGGGTIEGAGRGHEGEKLDVRVNGDKAIVPGLRLPIVLWSLGGAVLVLGAVAVLRGDRPPAAA
ncbi:MAG TPA: hypothetical protein VM266_09500 [Solirubrobacteraceae bacterium]|nr:hypothetical protein [Solirubrobacteraceae bacterium]